MVEEALKQFVQAVVFLKSTFAKNMLRGLLLLLMLQEKKKDFLCANGFLIRDSSLTLDPLKEKKNNLS